jgi:hypothetical protein
MCVTGAKIIATELDEAGSKAVAAKGGNIVNHGRCDFQNGRGGERAWVVQRYYGDPRYRRASTMPFERLE